MKIGIIEQNWLVARTLHDFLHDLGHEPRVLTDLREATAALRNDSQALGLIITDTLRHNGTGKQALKELHDLFPTVDIIATAIQSPGLTSTEAVTHGIYGFLHKPLRLTELELMLLRLGERRAARPPSPAPPRA